MGDITVRVNGTPHSPTVMEEEGSFLHHDLASITSPPARMRRTWARTGEEPARCARAGQGSCALRRRHPGGSARGQVEIR